jgi:hypothetical protein
MKHIIALLVALTATASSRAEIIYVNGPSAPIPAFYGERGVDLNGDGASDLVFWSGGMLCTADIPSSLCVWPVFVGSGVASQMIVVGSDAAVLPSGACIFTNPPADTDWNVPNTGADLVTSHSSPRNGTEGWVGSLAEAGVGYLGVRFTGMNGLHYGWVRVRLPQTTFALNKHPADATPVPLELTPVVVDWAYESCANTPIRAGAIEPGDDILFTAELFESGRRHRRLGAGTFILSNGTLRSELSLADKFSAADIRRAKNSRSQSKPLWSFAPPLVSGTNHTAFFGEARLTRPDLLALSQGLLQVSLDDGAAIGRIVPVSGRPVSARWVSGN